MKFYIALISILFSFSAYSQSNLHAKIRQHKSHLKNDETYDIFEQIGSDNKVTKKLNIGQIWDINTLATKEIVSTKPELLKLNIQLDKKHYVVELIRSKPVTENFTINRCSNKVFKKLSYNLFYQGVIRGEPNSLVAISFADNSISGIINLDNTIYNISKIKDSPLHKIYKENSITDNYEFTCHQIGTNSYMPSTFNTKLKSSLDSSSNCVTLYVEADYNLFLEFNSSINDVTNHIIGIINQVSAIYLNENINLQLNEIFIWDSPDSYSTGFAEALEDFRTMLDGKFNSDLAFLIQYSPAGGVGIAYLNTLCQSTKEYSVGVAKVETFFENVPIYSRAVKVITHEIGHSLGSPHTHDCAWNGNDTALDGCYPSNCDGNPTPPLPANGGTIMSYCDNDPGGINFNIGFGQQPGDLIRENIMNSDCTVCCDSVGMSCDDGNPCTENDQYNLNCDCIGIFNPMLQFDLQTFPVISCNDGDLCTYNDLLNANCECIGEAIEDTDQDGFCDNIDVDDDNDGILDELEFDAEYTIFLKNNSIFELVNVNYRFEMTETLLTDSIYRSIAYHPNGDLYLAIYEDIYLYDEISGGLLYQYTLNDIPTSISFSPEGDLVYNKFTTNEIRKVANNSPYVEEIWSTADDPLSRVHVVYANSTAYLMEDYTGETETRIFELLLNADENIIEKNLVYEIRSSLIINGFTANGLGDLLIQTTQSILSLDLLGNKLNSYYPISTYGNAIHYKSTSILNTSGQMQITDRDRDGILNHMDLDSDNDGISDAHEAAGQSHLKLENCRLDANGDADYDLFLAGLVFNAVKFPEDYDNDGIPNFLDLNSDNDNCSDATESEFYDTSPLNANDIQNPSAVVDENGIVLLGDSNICFNPLTTNWLDSMIICCADEGLECDDGNPCTINDHLNTFCECKGALNSNVSINDPDIFQFFACDDLNPCTVNDSLSINCECEGVLLDDLDNDGVCDLIDLDDDNDGILDTKEVDLFYYASIYNGVDFEVLKLNQSFETVKVLNLNSTLLKMAVSPHSKLFIVRNSTELYELDSDSRQLNFVFNFPTAPINISFLPDGDIIYNTINTNEIKRITNFYPYQEEVWHQSNYPILSVFFVATNSKHYLLESTSSIETIFEVELDSNYDIVNMVPVYTGNLVVRDFTVDFNGNVLVLTNNQIKKVDFTTNSLSSYLSPVQYFQIASINDIENHLNVNDKDFDGKTNDRDLDSDNDGIPDAIEAAGDINLQLENCRLDNNGDGSYLLDYFGNSTGILQDAAIYAIDSDNDFISDFLDLDSDNDLCSDAEEAGNPNLHDLNTLEFNEPSAITDIDGSVISSGCFIPVSNFWTNPNYDCQNFIPAEWCTTDQYQISNVVHQGYFAAMKIVSEGVASINVNYTASDCIELLPGFESSFDTEFEALIKDCPTFLINQIENGGLENGFTNWMFNDIGNSGANSNYTIEVNNLNVNSGNQAMKVEVLSISETSWHIMLRQANITLEEGKTYQLKFWAKADSNRKIGFSAQTNFAPFKNYGLSDELLSSSWKEYSTTFLYTDPTLTNTAKIYFTFGYDQGAIYWIDDIQLLSF